MSRRADFFCIHGAHTEDRASVEACLRREKGRQGNEPAFFINQHFSQPMTIQWLMAARKIGKRLASLEPPILSQLGNETHHVICGVAVCVVKRKKLRRITE